MMRINSRSGKKMTKGARREIVRCEQTNQTLLRDLPSQSGYGAYENVEQIAEKSFISKKL